MVAAFKTTTKIQYFDRSIIKRDWSRMNRGPLERSAGLVRDDARKSIKRRKKGGKSGPVGQPPRSRDANSSLPPFKMIFNEPIGLASQIVGMVGFTRKSGPSGEPIPGLHEHGGMAVRMVIRKTDAGRDKKGKFTAGKRQARVKKTVMYPQRPFMDPAKRKAAPKMAKFWKNSLSR